MDVIFTGNVSKEGQGIVKGEREEGGKHSHKQGWSFSLWSILAL